MNSLFFLFSSHGSGHLQRAAGGCGPVRSALRRERAQRRRGRGSVLVSAPPTLSAPPHPQTCLRTQTRRSAHVFSVDRLVTFPSRLTRACDPCRATCNAQCCLSSPSPRRGSIVTFRRIVSYDSRQSGWSSPCRETLISPPNGFLNTRVTLSGFCSAFPHKHCYLQ